ncbi:gamma-glutamyltransferase [Acetobacteraceae bacterium H6797]|nr:gamma-glutamyltransferase [Acetobacteraceae bacterium H6797]
MNKGYRITRHAGTKGNAPRAWSLAGLSATMMLAACSGGGVFGSSSPEQGQPGYVRGYLGGVITDEPRAALVARDVLSAGGSAVDAAVAAGFVLTVTYPSRAGLGGGGACLVHDQRTGKVEAVMFPATAPSSIAGRADRPAAVPMMARGLFALHTRGGKQSFEQLMQPAEQLARFGTEVSRAFAQDLAAVGAPLMADPWARQSFGSPSGAPLAEGARMMQPDLGGTLAALRVTGVGDLYQGAMARRLEEISPSTGAGLSVAAMRESIPQIVASRESRLGNDLLSTTPDAGGAATAAAFEALRNGADTAAAQNAALAAAGVTGNLPASTSLVVVDREGMAVSCNFTMNNLFGTGRVAAGTGILLGAAPVGGLRPALMTPIMVHNTSLRAIRYVGAGSGQSAAPVAAAGPAVAAVLRNLPASEAITSSVPEPGRAVALSCSRYLPGRAESCTSAADPRGAGIALGGLDR